MLSRIKPSTRTGRHRAMPIRRRRRAERELYLQIAERPQTVRDELLEMLSRAA